MAESKDGGFFGMDDITKFSGEDHTYTSTKWAQDLDDNAEIFKWTPLQRLIIARRSLTGTAELWLKTEKVHKTYEELKAAVLKEFPDAVNVKEMHELMSSRKKRNDESFYQYMLIMKEMGKRAKFPDYVAIQYIVDGIMDHETNKAVLYGATTYPTLKEKLAIYETIKKKTVKQHAERPLRQAGVASNKEAAASGSGSGQGCYNCGEKNHRASECRNGQKCFRCNQFGHISPHCTLNDGKSQRSVNEVKQPQKVSGSSNQQARSSVKQYESDTKKHSAMFGTTSEANNSASSEHVEMSKMTYEEEVNVVQSVNKSSNRQNKAIKQVKISEKSVNALFDTGSDVNLISEDLWQELEVPCCDDNTIMSGLGLSSVRSCGKIIVNLNIDGKLYQNVVFHVVPKASMQYKIIIGQEFICKVVMVVSEGAVVLLTKDVEWLSRTNVVNDTDFTGHMTENKVKEKIMIVSVQTKEAPMKMEVTLNDDIPIPQQPRKLSSIVKEQVEACSQKGIAQVSDYEYYSPLVFVKKKNGTTRVSADYRLLKKKIVKDEFRLPAKTYFEKRKPSSTLINLVAKRAKFDPGLKFKSKFLGPCKIKRNAIYHVEKLYKYY